MKLSIVIPVYNEEARLKKNVTVTAGYLESLKISYEIIIVDDGSIDMTLQVANELKRVYTSIRVLSYTPNRGKGYAVKRGVLESRGEYIFFIDTDGSTPIESLERFLPLLEQKKADVVIGSRNLQESNREVPQPYWRQMLGKIGNIMIRNLLSLTVKDTQCGFKGFTQSAAKQLFSKLTIDRWGFDFEIIVLANALQLRVKEVPVRWLDSEGSRFSPIGGSITTLLELLRVKYYSVTGKYNRKS